MPLLTYDGRLGGSIWMEILRTRSQPGCHHLSPICQLKVALATALDSSGLPEQPAPTAAGHFDGNLDEYAIWNVARTQAEIQGTLNSAITQPAGSPGGPLGPWTKPLAHHGPGSAGTYHQRHGHRHRIQLGRGRHAPCQSCTGIRLRLARGCSYWRFHLAHSDGQLLGCRPR